MLKIFFFSVISLFFLTAPAHAQSSLHQQVVPLISYCGSNTAVDKRIRTRLKAYPRFAAVGSKYATVVYINADNSTWVMVFREPMGRTCAIMAGKSWIKYPPDVENSQ